MIDGEFAAKFLIFLSVHTQIKEADRDTMAEPGPYKGTPSKGRDCVMIWTSGRQGQFLSLRRRRMVV